MVSSGQVTSDASSLSTAETTYSSAVDSLGSSWKGASFDSISQQAQQVASEFFSVIKTQMESFASACDKYESYSQAKSNYETASSNYNTAVSNNDSGAMGTYSSDMTKYSQEMDKIKQEILSTLSSISQTLTATSVATKDYASGTTVATGGANGVIQNAIDWALAIAADDTHGYSQETRWGNPNYDCSSLVISAYEAAGTGVKEAGATYTGDMRSVFTSNGFEWIPGDPDPATLQPGDILLNENSHTEMYIGDGMNVGAHDNYDGGDGDSSGSEINVQSYNSHPWDGVLRYVGYDSTQGTNT